MDMTEALLRRAAGREGGPSMAVCADAARLPLPDQSVDLVFSSLMLHWCPSLDRALEEVRRVLAFPGLFTFATLGPRSFQELRAAWRLVDEGTHVMPFPEMRALADGLVRAGLAEPVVDSETLTIHYRDLRQLTGDLRGTGTTNPSAQRRSGLTGRRTWQRLEAACDGFRDAGGALPVTLEILYGQCWAPASRTPGQVMETVVPLASIKRRPDR
jgi:malonyl-CoA O-methyltransferase